MRTPLEVLRQRRARRRYMPRVRRSRTGTTARVAAALLVLMVLVGGLIEMRRGGREDALLAKYASSHAVEPLDLIEAAGRTRRLLFLADIASAPALKRFAADAIVRLAMGPGLDLVVLDVPADEQPFIDTYLATSPEDPAILLGRPRAIRESDGASRTFIDLYRAVWRVNQELGAHRRVRIVAADHPRWPPPRALSPHEAARVFGERDSVMLDAVVTRTLARSPNARVFFFVDGLHAIRSGGGRVQTGGTTPVAVHWLAAVFAERFPQDVYTILTDAVPNRALTTDVAAYRGTVLGEALRRSGTSRGIGLRGAPELDAISRSPVRVVGTTGVDFTLEPRSLPFSRLADAYIYLGS